MFTYLCCVYLLQTVKSTGASDGQRPYGHDSSEPPAYESRPPSLHNEFTPTKTSLPKRLGSLYAPIRRYFHSIELRESGLTSGRKGSTQHRRATSLGTNQVEGDATDRRRSIETVRITRNLASSLIDGCSLTPPPRRIRAQ
jgi:hypothetical protein